LALTQPSRDESAYSDRPAASSAPVFVEYSNNLAILPFLTVITQWTVISTITMGVFFVDPPLDGFGAVEVTDPPLFTEP
jgi:hypothetical protein